MCTAVNLEQGSGCYVARGAMKTIVSISTLVCVVGLFAQAPAKAAVYDFSLVGVDYPADVFGSGQLFASGASSPYTVTGATGSITDPSGTFTIDGLSSYAGGDNLLYYPSTSYTSFGGISVATAGGPDFNLGGGGVSAPQFELLNNSVLNPGGGVSLGSLASGSYNIVLTMTAVPELSTWAMLGLGFAGLGLAAAGRGRKDAIAAIG